MRPAQARRLHVLFVDDEPVRLGEWRAAFAHLADGWNLTFADDASAAVLALESGPIDALVCEIRVADGDATRVLQHAVAHAPHVVRLALSDPGARELMLSWMPRIHSYLSRPAPSRLLETSIVQAVRIHSLLRRDELRELVLGMSVLPSLPIVLQTLLDELRLPEPSSMRIGELISQDPALSAQLLRVVNSPFFGLLREVDDPALAVMLLGLQTVGAVLVNHQLFSAADERLLVRVGLRDLFAHSVRTARRAATLARHFGGSAEQAGGARAAALLHDVGKLLLAVNFPERYLEAHTKASEGGGSLREAETACLGAPHDWVGGQLLALWGLPLSIVEAVAFHHEPGFEGRVSHGPLGLVHLANAIDHSPLAIAPPADLDTDYLAAAGYAVTPESWRQLTQDS